MNIQSTQNISRYLAQNARRISSTPFPLEKLEMAKIEGIQKGIKLFEGLKMQDIKFLTKWFQVLNLARGCREGCTFCLRNAQAPIKETLTQINTILWEDLQRFVDGFSKLSERIGENVLNGNSHITLFEDANLPLAKIKDLNGEKHTICDAIDSVYTKLGLPLVFVTAGWHLNDKASQKSAEEICKYIQDNPNCVKEFGISVNPFHKYKEDVYIEKMANTLKTFLPLYKNGFEIGIVILKYNFPNGIDSDKNGYESAKKLYEKIYEKLKQISDFNLEEYEILKPQNVCKHSDNNYIENKGRGQNFFLP